MKILSIKFEEDLGVENDKDINLLQKSTLLPERGRGEDGTSDAGGEETNLRFRKTGKTYISDSDIVLVANMDGAHKHK